MYIKGKKCYWKCTFKIHNGCHLWEGLEWWGNSQWDHYTYQ